MPELNLLSFFLLTLGGLGAIWSFRRVTKSAKTLNEFEYLCFSTLWGLPVFGAYAYLLRGRPDLINASGDYPIVASVYLFLIGVLMGYVSGFLWMRIINPRRLAVWLKIKSLYERR